VAWSAGRGRYPYSGQQFGWWTRVASPLVVTDTLTLDSTTDEGAQQHPEVVTACAMTCSASQEGDPEQIEQTNDTLSLAEYPLEVSQEELLEEQQSEETVESEQVIVNTDRFVDEPVVQVVDGSPLAHSSHSMVAASDDELRGPEECVLQGQLNNSEMRRNLAFVPKHLKPAQCQKLEGLSEFPGVFSDVQSQTKGFCADYQKVNGVAKPDSSSQDRGWCGPGRGC